jgi:hypothetical protein
MSPYPNAVVNVEHSMPRFLQYSSVIPVGCAGRWEVTLAPDRRSDVISLSLTCNIKFVNIHAI